MRRQVNGNSEITYQTGWCYHNQLNGLKTSAPHVLPEPGSIPADVDPAKLREQEFTRAGFVPCQGHATAYLYRAHPGPSWTRDGVTPMPAQDVAPYWLSGRMAPPLPQACLPRKYARASLEPGNAIKNMRTLFYNQDVSIGITECTDAMPFFMRNADGDDLFFVQEGSGVLETEFGPLGLEAGYFFWVPRGTLYRVVPDSPKLFMFCMENYGERFEKPDTGITGDAALYYHRNIQVPVVQYDLTEGDFEVVVKQGGGFTAYRYPHHPCDVIGWDGDLAPFRFNIEDFKPITSWRAHIPPSAYCAFVGQGFEVCCFVPRPVEHAERSLPVPFDHINHDRDEVAFFHKGMHFSRSTSEPGALSFHARGFAHGPHESAFQMQEERRQREGAFILDAYTLLIETSAPLFVAPWAETIEDKDYVNSWQT